MLSALILRVLTLTRVYACVVCVRCAGSPCSRKTNQTGSAEYVIMLIASQQPSFSTSTGTASVLPCPLSIYDSTLASISRAHALYIIHTPRGSYQSTPQPCVHHTHSFPPLLVGRLVDRVID